MGDSHPGRPGQGGPEANSAGPTGEERAAAATVLRMIWGIHISRAVYVVAALGLADLMADGPMTAAQLAGPPGHTGRRSIACCGCWRRWTC